MKIDFQDRSNSVLQGGIWENRKFQLNKQTGFPLSVSGYAEPEVLLESAYDCQCFEQATLGGHSLLSIQLISRLRDTFSVELPVQFLFDYATVATLAERIDASRHQSQVVPPIQPIDRDGTLSLSFGQARLWFLDQLDGQSSTYNLPIALPLSGLLQVEVLEKAIAEIIRHHEVLRTTFSEGCWQKSPDCYSVSSTHDRAIS